MRVSVLVMCVPWLINWPFPVANVKDSIQKQPPEVFCKKGVLVNFVKFTGKHLRLSLFFNNVAGLRPATLLKKTLWHRCFPMNFAKLLRTPFIEQLRWLLLSITCPSGESLSSAHHLEDLALKSPINIEQFGFKSLILD